MKLIDLHEDTDKRPPAPGSLGDLYTTKQVAEMLGVTAYRVRQLKMEGRIRPVEGPVPGHQESLYSAKEVEKVKRELEAEKRNVGKDE